MNIRYRTIQKLKKISRVKMRKSTKYRNCRIYNFDPILLRVDEEYLNRYNIVGNSSHPTN